MAFEGVGPFWPNAVVADESDCYGFQTSSPGESNVASVRWAAGASTTYIRLDPGVQNKTTGGQAGQPAGVAAAGKGWQFPKADLNASASLPAKRRIPAGTWTIKCMLNSLDTDTDQVFGFYVNVYKRHANGTFTHLGGAESAMQGLVPGQNPKTASPTLPEVILETDESIHLEYWYRGNGGAVTQVTVSFRIGTAGSGDVATVQLPGAGLRYLYPRSSSASGSPAATLGNLKIRKTFSVAASAAAAFAKKTKKVLSVAGTSGATFSRRLSLKRAFSVSAAETSAVSVRKKSPRSFAVAGTPDVVFARRLVIRRAFSVVGSGAVVLLKVLRAQRAFSVSGAPGASFSRIVRSRRLFGVAGTGGVSLWVRLREDVLDRMEGGGTVVKKIIAIFDD